MGNCWSRLRIMGDCWPRFESSESTSRRRPGSTLSLPPNMEPSEPSPLDSIGSSPPMKPSPPSSVDSVRPPPINGIESIREMYEKTDTAEQMDRLISFVENHLQKMNNPSEAGSSSSEGWLEIVRDGTKLGAKIIDTICTEAEKLSNSDAVKAVENVTLKVMKGLGNLRCLFIGLSVAAYAVENYLSAGSTDSECRDILLNILELAKDVNRLSKRMSDERETEKLCNAVGTIVEGTVIFCDYLKRGNIFRFWSATTAAAQLKKTNQQLRNVKDSLALSSLQQLLDFQWRKDYGGDKDVFLSHSGTQKNFVRQLHRDLTRQHVSCFFDEDQNSLPLAQRFPPLIFEAAEKCKIAVLVLSKEFVRSKWPMLELSAFISAMNSGKNPNLKLLPIFFMITPKELSYITKDSPEWEKLGVSNDTRDKWHVALKVVRSINGLSFSEGGDEVQLRDKVVKKICCLLNRINAPQLLDFEPVGIGEQVQEVKELLNMEGSQSALAVIVYGFGGMGKSTIAASVVQSLDWSTTNFKFCRVAVDEKTPNKTSHVIELQKYIIYKLGDAKPDFQDPLDGRIQIKKALSKKSSLLFIDNVFDKNYVRDLLPQDLQSGDQETKLRLIITSREKNVKAELNIICNEYEVKGLSDTDSERLLVDTIVQSQVIEEDEKGMINEVAVACKGVPLLLSVFGKHLRVERNKDSYQEALDVLRKGNLDTYRDEDLSTKLMFVYDKIKDIEVKEAFLDICTYFHGWEWNLVADILDFLKLEDLRRRTLVSKSGSNEVIVHDILRLMGMEKARLTRFSNCKELSDALEDDLDGSVKVKGISLVNDDCLITILSTQLEAMHKSLRVLMLGDWVTLDGPPCHKAFRNLRYLRLGDITAFPFKDPSKLDKLRVFLNRSKAGMSLSHLPSSVQRISHEVPYVECNEFKKLPFQNLSCLKSFIVKTKKSVELPEEVHLPASLVDLHLSRCKNLPKDIGHLTALQSLILDRSDLECLPQGFGKLQKLKHLSIDYCSKLAFLSKELGNISSLESLSMEGCGNLRALPESFGKLRIDKLNFRSLVDLQELPNGFGNMPLLKFLRLESCHSLMSLPLSFVQLKMLETLEIIGCTKLSVLPKDFGQLIYLKYVTVEYCPLLKELPHGFGALPGLKTFKMKCCNGFVNLPRDFSELTSLEELRLESLHLVSRIPDGFGKLKRLRFLDLYRCLELKTLSNDFENMASLELLAIRHCPEIDGAMMEKILKLQSCFMADVYGSDKLLEKWEEMKDEQEHPIAVLCLHYGEDRDRENRAIWVALLNGKCLELNNTTGQLIDRSSLLGELKEGTNATVALIIVPIQMQSHQHQMLQRFVEMAMETAKTNGSGMLQIVCARKFVWSRERRTQTEEEERAEEQGIRQILLLLPEKSCVIPSTESKRAKIITWCCIRYDSFDEFHFFIGHVVADMEGRKTFENFEFVDAHKLEGRKSFENFEVVDEDETSEIVSLETVITNKHHNNIQNFIESICFWDADVVGENKTRKFIETLKGNGIDYLIIEGQQLMVDDLLGKTIGFILCTFKHFEFIKLQQIFKDLQQNDSNFIAIWIPTVRPEDFGHGTYTRATQCRPWATFPFQLVKVLNDRPCFVVLDKGGHITNKDALKLLLAWGVKSYPFTQHTISESSFSMEADSCLEFLLQGMDIVGRKPMKSKMTFLYVRPPGGLDRKWEFEMKCKFEELTKINGNFEVLYVGISHELDLAYHIMETRKQDYDFATQNMPWLSLSFSDMIMFWYRCKETPHELAKMLVGLGCHRSLLLLDNNGAVTRRGYDVLQMIFESSNGIWDGEGMAMVKDEVMKSLSTGECSPLVRIFFRDEIRNLPQHPHHRLLYFVFDVHYISHARKIRDFTCGRNIRDFTCGVCNVRYYRDGDDWNPEMSYRCDECEWEMCGNCWIAYAKQQVEQLLSAKDN